MMFTFGKFIQKFGHERIKESIRNNKNVISITRDLFGYTNGKKSDFVKIYIKQFEINTEHFDVGYKNRKWEKIKRNCLLCGKVFITTKKADKKTCSCKCSNIYFSGVRTENAKGTKDIICVGCGKKITIKKHSGSHYCKECLILKKEERTKCNICTSCGKRIGKGDSGLCSVCLYKSPEYRKKMSEVAIKRVKEGKHVGWKSRSNLEPSYPEKYFMGLFQNENIKYVREKKIGKYFADFTFPGKIVLEVDGKQHKFPDRKASDKRKDIFLKGKGYKVFRIDWYNPSNKKGKDKLYPQIEAFKEFLTVAQW